MCLKAHSSFEGIFLTLGCFLLDEEKLFPDVISPKEPKNIELYGLILTVF